MLAGCADEDPEAERLRELMGRQTDTRYMAVQLCRELVRSRLKAPATAVFPDQSFDGMRDDYETRFGKSGDGYAQVVVSAYVDAQNSFGALLRTPWSCRVSYTGGSYGSLDEPNYLGGAKDNPKNWRVESVDVGS
jgi:hypothetical protein